MFISHFNLQFRLFFFAFLTSFYPLSIQKLFPTLDMSHTLTPTVFLSRKPTFQRLNSSFSFALEINLILFHSGYISNGFTVRKNPSGIP